MNNFIISLRCLAEQGTEYPGKAKEMSAGE